MSEGEKKSEVKLKNKSKNNFAIDLLHSAINKSEIEHSKSEIAK